MKLTVKSEERFKFAHQKWHSLKPLEKQQYSNMAAVVVAHEPTYKEKAHAYRKHLSNIQKEVYHVHDTEFVQLSVRLENYLYGGSESVNLS